MRLRGGSSHFGFLLSPSISCETVWNVQKKNTTAPVLIHTDISMFGSTNCTTCSWHLVCTANSWEADHFHVCTIISKKFFLFKLIFVCCVTALYVFFLSSHYFLLLEIFQPITCSFTHVCWLDTNEWLSLTCVSVCEPISCARPQISVLRFACQANN